MLPPQRLCPGWGPGAGTLAPRWGLSLVQGICHLAQLVTLAFELRDRAKQHGIARAQCEAEGSMTNGIRRDSRWHMARQQVAYGKTANGMGQNGNWHKARWQTACGKMAGIML